MSTNNRFSRRQVLKGLAAAPVALSGLNSFGTWVSAAEPTPDAPDAIVVGAGAVGCATAWHLHKKGKKVLVVEAQPSAATQSTRGAAGFVALWSGVHAAHWKKQEWELQRYGIDFYTALAQRDVGNKWYYPSGIVYVYQTPSAWKRVQKRITTAQGYGTKLEVLTAERAKQVTPFLEFDKLAGIAYDPDSIRVRAGEALPALAKELAADGVQFKYDTPVTDFLRDDNGIAGVRTADGDIRCQKVVVTAGAWSRPLVEKINGKCPATPFTETRYVTKPLAEIKPDMPMVIIADKRHFYIREEQGGLLIGGGDDHPLPPDRSVDAEHPPWCKQIPQDQAQRVFGYAKELIPFFPAMDKAEIGTILSGIPTRSEDSLFLAGPVPGIEGLFAMSGCQEAGITHGPGLARILAEYVVDGKTHWDASRYRLDRFKA